MKLIYDISVLAWSVKNKKAKTGIFRVIENVMFQLLKDSALELYLTSIHGNISDAKEYLKNQGIQLEDRYLLFPKESSWKKDILFKTYQWVLNRFDWKKYQFVSSFLKSIVSTLLYPFFLLFGLREYLQPIPLDRLTKDYIFHSTFLPIPKYILDSEIGKIITIYDVIAIKYPQYFFGNTDEVIWKLFRDLKKTHAVITISEYSKEDLLSLTNEVSDEKVYVTPLAASQVFYQELSDTKINEVVSLYGLKRGSYVLSVATLEPRKNLKNTINAFLEMGCLSQYPELKLVLIGGKGWGTEQENLIGGYSKEQQGRILFVGFVSDDLLASIYSGALFFVYMSFCEGFGLPPLEAMQCGVPVLVSNTSSLPEVVGEAGMYANPNDVSEISSHMETFLREKSIREEMSKQALGRAKLFTWEKTASLTKKVYQRTYESNH